MYATRTVAQTVWLLISVGLWSAHTPVRAGVVRGIQEMQVPRIVNHIMPVEATKVERESYASIRSRCKEQHPGWKFKMWTLQSGRPPPTPESKCLPVEPERVLLRSVPHSAGEHLLQQRYAWFLDTYHGFKLNISKCMPCGSPLAPLAPSAATSEVLAAQTMPCARPSCMPWEASTWTTTWTASTPWTPAWRGPA